jgi:chromate reductase
MSEPYDVAVLVGSLRRDSYTRAVARNLMALAPGSLKLEIVEIGQLSFYNQDLEPSAPEPWQAFRARIRRAHAVIFATPEYNRSVPAVLKNALDVGSRPPGAGVWAGKPAAVIGVSPGVMGAFGASQHLRQTLTSVNMSTMQGPEAYVGGVAKLLQDDGRLVSGSEEFLSKYLAAFAAWVERLA